MARSTNWRFTLNNYTDADIEDLRSVECRYICFGKEVGESGTPHLQGLIVFQTKKSLRQVSIVVPRSNLDVLKDTPKGHTVYCSKGTQSHEEYMALKASGPTYGVGADVYLRGDCPLTNAEKGESGKRTWDAAVKAVEENRLDDLPESYAMRLRQLEYYVSKRRKVLDHLPDGYLAVWVWGPTGVGKSHHIRALTPRPVEKKGNSKWWPATYNGTDAVIIDEVAPGKVSPEDMKAWTDRYVFPIETKGGEREVRPKQVYVTSQYRIRAVYPEEIDYTAIERRCLEVHRTSRDDPVDYLPSEARQLS